MFRVILEGTGRTSPTGVMKLQFKIWMGTVLKWLDMTQIVPAPKPTVFKTIFVEITTKKLCFDTQSSPSSRQDSFIYLYFQKDWLTEFNLSCSPVSVKSLVVEWKWVNCWNVYCLWTAEFFNECSSVSLITSCFPLSTPEKFYNLRKILMTLYNWRKTQRRNFLCHGLSAYSPVSHGGGLA